MSGLGNINGWSDEDYHAVMRAAEETFLATARLRAILPRGPKPKERYYPAAPRIGEVPGARPTLNVRLQPAADVEPIEVRVDLDIEHKYLNDMDFVVPLARRAGQILATEESWRLFERIQARLVAVVGHEQPYERGKERNNARLREALNSALEKLHDRSHLGPHLLVMTPQLHGDYRELLFSNSNRSFVGDALGGDLKDAGVPARGAVIDGHGLLISVGSSTVEFIEVDRPALSLVEYGRDKVTFRLEERVAVRVVDDRGVLHIKPVPPASTAAPPVDACADAVKALAAELKECCVKLHGAGRTSGDGSNVG